MAIPPFPVILLAAEYEGGSLVEAIWAGANALVSRTNAYQTLLDAIAGNEALSPREARIADAAARDLRNHEIAREVELSEAMVKLYLNRIYARLGLANRTELALYMQRSETAELTQSD